jgi:cell division protein FtsI/penicillin-binding protein 2
MENANTKFEMVKRRNHFSQYWSRRIYSYPLQAMATAITANKGSHVTPHVLRDTKGSKKFTVHNAPDGKIQFNGTEQDWLNMHAAMIDVIQSGTGRY